jgi:hypothetical protein
MPVSAAASISERATLLPSPMYATGRPSRSPKRSRSVSTSASAWHGWWSSVRALITGADEAAATSSTSRCANVRITIAAQ